MIRWSPIFVALICSAPAHAAPPTINAIAQVLSHADFAGRYEKLELTVDLAATYDNPFDPDQVDLSAEFVAPSGNRYAIWGFYDPQAQRWLVRFAPTEPGPWRYTVTVRDGEGAASSEPREFRCAATIHHGFVGISPNRRYFQYGDGASFYGVGLWYNDHFKRRRGAIAEDDLDRLRRLGVNFISFYPSLLETDATGLGRYDGRRARRLDELVGWCEARDLYISWNLVFHANVSDAVWGEGNAEYHDNPYRTIAPARDFFASDEAWKYQQKLYRYVIARWGYSRAVFLWFVVDEINGTEGWTEGDREAAHAWCRRINDFFHEHEPYGRPTTGTQSGGVDQWWPEGYEIFDVAGREIYEAQGHPMPRSGKPDLVNDHPLRASYLNYARQTQALWRGFEKPAIIAECGFDHTYYEPGMPGYLATYHNALWATLAAGGAATPFWWAYSPYINESVATSQIRWFANFVRDVDFAGAEWRPQAVEISAGDAWAMQSDRQVVGWAVNPTSGIARETLTLAGLNDGEYEVHLYRTWRGAYMPPIAVDATGGAITFVVPELTARDGRAQHMGDDVAFKITPRGAYRPAAGRRER